MVLWEDLRYLALIFIPSVANFYKLFGLNSTNLFPKSFGSQKFEIKV